MNINNEIFFTLYNFANKSILGDNIIIFLAQYLPYVVIVLAGIFLLFHHEVFSASNPLKAFAQKWKEIVLVFFSGVFAWCVAQVLKILINTDRPFMLLQNVSSLISETGKAFPSGHATFFMALAFALFFSHKKVGYLFMFFALIIGLARIFAGVHFPIDILGGFILGALTAYLVKFVYNRVHH